MTEIPSKSIELQGWNGEGSSVIASRHGKVQNGFRNTRFDVGTGPFGLTPLQLPRSLALSLSIRFCFIYK